MSIRIVSTKKLLSNQKQYLLNAGFAVVEADFITTKPVDFQLKNVHDTLIFSSQNGVESVLKHPKIDELKTKDVFCVGIKTKNLLEANGFNVIAYTGYAEDLAEIITLVYGNNKYTFFSGNLRRDTLPDALTEAEVVFNEITVYETILTPQKIDTKPDGILFFSPSGVESYLKQNTITKEIAFCIGNTTAEAASQSGIKNIIIANSPTIENTIIQCINEFK
ncbi:uroporphyrinogen-III synthase [Flavobacterium sp.]|uniref:uroporphyrinogen-III synthase n=1 Tax=Flavobacterium sp. TaxID=239 RepID=UPI0028BDC2ED|nr:uroporphyrinogen-III synthase [Flavobacterium sp.]